MLSGDEQTKAWGCSECKGHEYADQDHLRVARNCDGEHPSQTIAFEWAPELNRCPYAAIPREAWEYMATWSDYCLLEVLPYPGGLGEQPAHVYQALRRCELTRAEVEEKETRKIQREQERVKQQAKKR